MRLLKHSYWTTVQLEAVRRCTVSAFGDQAGMASCTANVRFRVKADIYFCTACPLLTKADIGGPFRCRGFCRYHCLSLVLGETMRRRDLIKLFASSAVAWPLAAQAQRTALPLI